MRKLRPLSDLKRGFLTLALVFLVFPTPAEATESLPWVIGAKKAAALIADEEALVLDTRSVWAYRRGHVKGAIRAEWTRFSRKKAPHKGELLERAQLQAALREVGVRADRPVIVVGSPPDDWGEDGRVVWMLRAAGHRKAALVNGGWKTLKAVGVPVAHRSSKPSAGNFVVRPVARWSADQDHVRKALGGDTLLLDTRESREYRGATPYGESRGGHLPGARHLHFRELMDSEGRLLTKEAIRAKLKKLGASRESSIIAYCTGGVRSGWMVAVLRWAGFDDVRNYAGSMWQWAASPAKQFPLTEE